MSLRSTDALASLPTAIVALLLVPLLNALVVTAVSFSVGTQELSSSAQAAVLTSVVGSIIATVASQAGMDRMRGIVAEVAPYGLLRSGLWVGKACVGVLTGAATATFLVAALTVSGHGCARFAVLALAAIGASLPAGVAAAMLSLRARDPFALANLVTWVLPVTAGTVISTGRYPGAMRVVVRGLPGTWLVRALRGETPLWVGFFVEFAVGLGWLVVAAASLRHAERRYRSGISDSLPI